MRRFLARLGLALALLLAPLDAALAGFGTPVDLGNNSTTPSAVTTLALTTNADINIGDLVIVLGGTSAANNSFTGATDSGGVNVYSFIAGASTNPAISMAWTIATAKVNAGGTITGTGYTAGSVRKGITAFKVTPTSAVLLDSIAPATTSNTSTTNNITSGLLHSPPIIVIAGFNSGSVDPGTFTDSNNFTRATATPTNMFLWLYFRQRPDTATTTWTPVWTNSVLNRLMMRAWDAPGSGLMMMGVGP